MRLLHSLARLDARHRLALALVAAAAVFFSMRGHVRFFTQSIATWDTYAFFTLVLAWLTILTTPTHTLRARAREQDVSRFVIFVFVVIAACAALFAVGFLISVNKDQMRVQSAKALAKREDTLTAVTPAQAVALSLQQRGECHR